MTFPVSGLDIPVFLPPVVGFVLGAVCAGAGVSGAFLLMPFQVSVLGFTSPAVSPTNLLYNLVGIPGGLTRYRLEGRLDGWLAAALVGGYLPGMFLGVLVRIRLLPDPVHFKFFLAAVLLFLALRMLASARAEAGGGPAGADGRLPDRGRLQTTCRSWRRIEVRLGDLSYRFSPAVVGAMSLAVGVVAGAYGIGGGSLMAPLLVTFCRIPIHAMAGANLLATFLASLLGIGYYTLLGPLLAGPEVSVQPDWLLGCLFGVGGLAGTFCGARWQRYLSGRVLKFMLAGLMFLLGLRYMYSLLA